MGSSSSHCCLRRDDKGSQLSLGVLAATHGGNDLVEAKLLAKGMSSSVVLEKREMFRSAAQQLIAEGLDPHALARVFWVPGRVEVGGKHTDYAGGRSLLAAVSRGFAVVSVDRYDDVCRIFTTFGGKSGGQSLGPLQQAAQELAKCRSTENGLPLIAGLKPSSDRRQEHVELKVSKDLQPNQGHWSAYPAVAIRRLARNFDIKFGADVAVECDLPKASGMSSSSAVICYMWLVLSERNNIRDSAVFKKELRTDEELYSYLGFIENGQNCGDVLVGDKGVGTFGGSEDHTAIMSSEPGKLNLFSYCPTTHEARFAFPSNLTFVIAVSGALAEKTGDAMADYNNAAFLARDAAACWCDASGEQPLGGKTFVTGRANLAEVVRHVRQALTADGGKSCNDDVRKAIGDMIAKRDDGKTYGPHGGANGARYRSGSLRERFEQFFDESEVLTPALAQALKEGDAAEIGRTSDESHRQTVECLKNTIPETAWLPQEARRQGAIGASAFGAGFGGSCWAVVEKVGAHAFARKWKAAYVVAFPRWKDSCEFFVTEPGTGAFAFP